ncbi:HWE histidine kinase domain-containing protein [Rhizobium sp. HT1-10]|uniref:HWE histidine kinase domain-containing protein n=1 Tax=Rhizobium sp. HT1-10 TaxID=3111638 RepID=UPI003C29FB19
MSYDRSEVNLTNCDREPIHIPGTIQPHGSMLVIGPDGHTITHTSANIKNYLAANDDIVGKSLSDVLGSQIAHELANASARAGNGHVAAVLLNPRIRIAHQPTDITVHRFDDRMFVELERSASDGDAELALSLTQSLVRRINHVTEVDAMVKTASRLVKAMLGYDRVMVYRFLHNGAGRVVAEAKDTFLQSFLGQHFPFSDIPVQARNLYMKNWIRVIGDVNFVPIPVVPDLLAGEPPIDMSFAHLRSVSPIHCEYLRNMGVAASMSISIVVNGELWGLIACHHNSPKILSSPLRVATELFAQYFSLHLGAAETRAQQSAASLARIKLDAITSTINASDDIESGLKVKLRDFSTLLDCDGSALRSGGKWSRTGLAPDEGRLDELIAHARKHSEGVIWHDNFLSEAFPGKGYGEDVAGLLAIPISVSRESYLLFFRSEEAHTVEWAGEPSKATVSGPSGDRLTPRGSFEAWREDVRHRSTPWTKEDLAVAESIRSYVRDILLHHNDRTEEQRSKDDERRSVLNAEMNHRVKNILALVKSIATQTGASALDIEEFTKSFDGRLRALSFAHDQTFSAKDGGELSSLLEAEAAIHRSGERKRIELNGTPLGLTERAFGVFALVIHEMMTNAAKYGSLSVPDGRLEVSWTLNPAGDCELVWVETGGPKVRQPKRKGFGSTLIDKTVKFDLGGSAELTFDKGGLNAKFVIPAEHHYPVTSQKAQESEAATVGQPLVGMTVMLVEDQGLIALDTEDVLQTLGAKEVRMVPNVALALQSIMEREPDCAVLDLNLGKETSEKVAFELTRRGVPFVFATGYRDSVSIPDEFNYVPVVRKPITVHSLAVEMAVAMGN